MVPRNQRQVAAYVPRQMNLARIARTVFAVPEYAVPAAANAMLAVGAEAAGIGKRIRQGYSNIFPSKKSKKTVKSVVSRDGVSSPGSSAQRGKKRKSKAGDSLLQRIKKLEKRNPPMSSNTYTSRVPLFLESLTGNQGKFFQVICRDTGAIENCIDGLPDAPIASGFNASIKINNQSNLIMLKNQTTANVEVKYCYFQCKDSSSYTYFGDYKAQLADRGVSLANTEAARTPNGATTGEVPASFILNGNELGVPLFMDTDHWKKMGKVTKATIGPGDVMKLSVKLPNGNYKNEVLDREGTTYIKDWDVVCVIYMLGDFQQNTSNNMISRNGFTFNGERFFRCTASVEGDGRKKLSVTSLYQTTGIDAGAEHADNQASAMEISDHP